MHEADPNAVSGQCFMMYTTVLRNPALNTVSTIQGTESSKTREVQPHCATTGTNGVYQNLALQMPCLDVRGC